MCAQHATKPAKSHKTQHPSKNKNSKKMHIIPPLIHMQKATNSHVMFVQNATFHTKPHKTQHLTTKTKQFKKIT